MGQALQLLRDATRYARVGMPKQIDPPAANRIKVGALVFAIQPSALPTANGQWRLALRQLHLRAGVPNGSK